MSKLIVEICMVDEIEKHPNADRLSIATIKGWKCIVGLDEYKVGDAVVFCPPDSIIPSNLIEKYKLEYLRKDGRVKTVKLRKCISQGLVFSLAVLTDGEPCRLKLGGIVRNRDDKVIHEGFGWGTDVAKLLNITKYEPPEPTFQIQGRKKSRKHRNILFDVYTDIENIKNYPDVFKEGEQVVITEKIHGTNFRAGTLPKNSRNIFEKIWNLFTGKYEFVYGSHKVQITGHLGRKCFYGDDVYGKIAEKYKLKDIIPKDYIIYGEIYGHKIQDLTYGLKDIDVKFFDVKYKGKYLGWNDFLEFCRIRQLPVVPIIEYGPFNKWIVKEKTTGTSVIDLQSIKEGCVIKPVVEDNHPMIGRKVLKSINAEYLLKKNRTEHH